MTARQHSTAIVLAGQPSWLPIGPEVYQERDVAAAADDRLSVRRGPRWFDGFSVPGTREQFDAYMVRVEPGARYSVESAEPYPIPSPPPFPQSIADVPVSDQGCRLTLAVSPTSDPNTLVFRLRLSSGSAPLCREVEHRWSNTLPFLFAFYVDHTAVSVPAGAFGREGGIVSIVPLVAAGQTREWDVRVDAGSVRALLPDCSPHVVSVVAAYCNSQHEGYAPGAMRLLQRVLMEDGKVPTTVLVRSEPASVRWDPDAVQWRSE